MSHYYSPDPLAPHRVEVIQYSVMGKTLSFTTDSGVFSRKGVDFGSDFLIRNLPPLTGRLLDLGCGYGPIGISLATLNPGLEVLMTDVNRRALNLAEKNIATNGITNIRVLESDGFTAIKGLFSTIVSNPPIRAGKDLIYPLFRQSYQYLQGGGRLWLVIQKKQGASSTLALLNEIYGNCTAVKKAKGYWLLCCKKKQPSC